MRRKQFLFFGIAAGLLTVIFAVWRTGNAEARVEFSNPECGENMCCAGSRVPPPPPGPTYYTLTVSKTGSGTVTSFPAGISCGPTCAAPYVSGTTVSLFATPAPGYIFGYWSGACTGGGGCSVLMDAGRQVTANFIPYYTLTVAKVGNGRVTSTPAGIDCGATCSAQFYGGVTVTLTATADPGWVFGSWSGACTGSGGCSVVVNSNTSITATFRPQLVVTKTGPGLVTSSPAGISCGLACTTDFAYNTSVTLTAAPDPGYIFQGWTGDCTGTDSCVLTMSSPHTVGARFGPWLTASVSGQGAISSTPSVISVGPDTTVSNPVPFGTAVTLTATANPNWQFTGWSGDCSGTADCVVTMDADHSVTATFKAIYTLTLNVENYGVMANYVAIYPFGDACQIGPCVREYTDGTELSIHVFGEDPSWSFVGWTGDCSGQGYDCYLTMDGDKTTTAVFGHTLTVSKTGNGSVSSDIPGINCGTDCTENFLNNQVVTLTPNPESGWQFTGWSGSCTGTGACTVVLDQHHSVAATFKPILSVTSNGNGAVMSDVPGINCGAQCTATYDVGTVVTLTATPDSGNLFGNWGGDCTGVIGPVCTITMNGPHSVSVTFTPLYTLTASLGGTGVGTMTSDVGGINCPGTCTAEYLPGTTVTLTATAPEGYLAWPYWGGDCPNTLSPTCTLTMDGPKTALAVFNVLLTLHNDTAVGSINFSYGGTACNGFGPCVLNASPNSQIPLVAGSVFGYAFAGWTGDCTGTGPCTVTLSEPRDVTATWTRLPYETVTLTNPGGGRVFSDVGGMNCAADCIQEFPTGTVVAFTTETSFGYSFDGWTGDCAINGTNPTCALTIDAAKNIGVSFTQLPTYPLTINLDDYTEGYVNLGFATCADANWCTFNVPQGITVNLSEMAYNPASGPRFAGWSGDCTGDMHQHTCTLVMDGPKNATASWAPYHWLDVSRTGPGGGTITSSPEGVNCGSDCRGDFPEGFPVTLTAVPNGSSEFTGWSGGGCSGTNLTCVMTMPAADTVVNASFGLGKNLSFNGFYLNGDGTGGSGRIVSSPAGLDCTGPCSAYFPTGTEVTITAYADPGYSFNRFGITGCTTNPCTVWMNADQQFTTILNVEPPRTLYVSKGGSMGGNITSSPAGIDTQVGIYSANFPYHTTVTLTATPDTGMAFTGWSGGGCAGTGTCQIVLDDTTNVTANFEALPYLTANVPYAGGRITSTPAGIDCGYGDFNCGAYFPNGTVVTLHAQPSDANHYFYGWTSGECDSYGTGDCTVVMDQNRSAGWAVFMSKPVLRLVVNDGISGPGRLNVDIAANDGRNYCTGYCDLVYEPGVTVTVTPDAGATFLYWGEGTCAGEPGPTCTRMLTGDVEPGNIHTVTGWFSSPGTAITEPTTSPPKTQDTVN